MTRDPHPGVFRFALDAAWAAGVGGGIAQLGELVWVDASIPARDALRAMVIAGGFAGLVGGACAAALFGLRTIAGYRNGAPELARSTASFRIAGFVFVALAMLAVANGRALQFEDLLPFTRVAAPGVIVAAVGVAALAWRRMPRAARGLDPLAAALLSLLAVAVTRDGPLAAASCIAIAGLAVLGVRFGKGRGWPRIAGAVATATLVVVALLPDARPGAAAAQATAPAGSVVLIVLDTQRADHLGPYGGTPGDTPAFDRFAAAGLVFDQAISASPWTLPSHASMFSGMYPSQHRCWFGDRRWLPDEVETVSERFAAAGYETRAFVSNGYLMLGNVLQGFETRSEPSRAINPLTLTTLMRYSSFGFARWIDKGASDVVADLGSWFEGRDASRPFFLFVNLFEVHDLYQPPHAWRALPEGATTWDAVNATRRFDPTRWHSLRRRAGRHEDVIRSLYRSEVRYQDARLGEILDVIDRYGARDDVAVVVTADHGDNLGEGGRWGHLFALNDALVHVPLVVRAPQRVSAGTRRPEAVSTIDLAPTLLDLAGLGDALGEGRSLLASDSAGREATFAEVFPDYPRIAKTRIAIREPLAEFQWGLTAIRKDGFKLVVPEHGPAKLYDLRSDAGEASDVIAEHADRAVRLQRELDAWRAAHPRSAAPASDARESLDDETRRRLEALGYL